MTEDMLKRIKKSNEKVERAQRELYAARRENFKLAAEFLNIPYSEEDFLNMLRKEWRAIDASRTGKV